MKKLTKIQNKVVRSLQNGYQVITNNGMTGAWIGDKNGQFYITGKTFWSLVNKGVLWQQFSYPQDYILTDFGENIKTTQP